MCLAKNTLISIQFIFVTPEATDTQKFRIFFQNLVALKKVTRIVFDEAHNIIHADYRPQYCKMGWMTEKIPVTLLSATIPQDPKFVEDIKKAIFPDGSESLLIKRTDVVCRPELSCRVIRSSQKEASALIGRLVRDSKGNTIIYIPTKKLCVELSEMLFGSKVYHADMTLEERRDVEKWWFIGGDAKIIVATSAFGEGIDSPNVTMVINYLIVHSMIDGLQQVNSTFFTYFLYFLN